MVRTGEEKSFNQAALEAVKEAFPQACFYFFERKLFTKKRGWFDAPSVTGTPMRFDLKIEEIESAGISQE